MDLSHLNPNQLEAVQWNDGPMLVLAGPGSGKTAVLTCRTARLLQENPDVGVLALTFTTKAATEMRERVDKLLNQRADRAHLCTFHSFAADILRQHGSHLGLRPDFSLLTQDEDRLAILEDAIGELGGSAADVTSDRKNLLSAIDHLFGEGFGSETQDHHLVRTRPWLGELFHSYCNQLVKSNRLDFGALLSFSLKLLIERPAVAKAIRLAWSHVCVDEFQDTNKAQYTFLYRLMAGGPPNLFVVADDDQIIYQWNGASPERLQQLRSDFNMTLVQLPENYRCPPEIIAHANALIGHNRSRTPDKKPLVAARSSDGEPVVRRKGFATADDEVAFVVKDITERELKPGDCAVLARAGYLLDAAATTLRSNGLNAYVARRKTEFEAPIIQWLFSVLRLANTRHDREILRRLCVAWQEIGGQPSNVEGVVAAASLIGGDFLRAWFEDASGGVPESVRDLLTMIGRHLVDRLDFLSVVDDALAKQWHTAADDQLALEEWKTWQALHDEVLREHDPETISLNAYLQEMDLRSKAPVPAPDAVRCMTVHGSKGLEFQHVYIIGMAQGIFPSYQAVKAGQNSKEMEEERRNFFVAITRVQKTLTLTRANTYKGWSRERSQFANEMANGNA